MKNGLTYFWCGGIAVFLSWALSGCYIGNKEVDAPYNGPWFYETELSNVQVCAATNGQAAVCKNSILSTYLPQFYIPLAVGANLNFSQVSDPLILSELDPTSAAALAANYSLSDSTDGSVYFFVNANQSPTPTSAISYNASTQVEVFHDASNNDSPTCLMDTTVSITGNLTNSGPFDSYSSNPLSGRMIYTINISMTPDATVNTGCAQAVLCFNNPTTDCQGVSYDEVHSVFQDFVALGAMDLSTNPTVNSLSYTIKYQ
jgi:hypothetical protein